MAVINTVKLTREWFNSIYCSQHGINQAISDEDINVLGHIHMPRPVHWKKKSSTNDQKICKRQVNIVNHKPAALAQISIATSGENCTRVVLEKGIIRGLKERPLICIPLEATDLGRQFGDGIEFDCSQAVREDLPCHERPSSGPVIKEKRIIHGTISALIHYKKKECEWEFTCQNATLTATAVINTREGLVQRDLAEIIRDLKQWQDRKDLKDIRVDDGMIRFTISGNVIFRWDSEHKVVW